MKRTCSYVIKNCVVKVGNFRPSLSDFCDTMDTTPLLSIVALLPLLYQLLPGGK